MSENSAAVSEALGFAPADVANDSKDEHPDGRPCPSWCWVSAPGNEYGHEVEVTSPATARHGMEAEPVVRATLYPALSRTPPRNVVELATMEPRLEQRGSGRPVIKIALRWYTRRKNSDGTWEDAHEFDHERLKMLVPEARELATALTYLADVADGKREPIRPPDDGEEADH